MKNIFTKVVLTGLVLLFSQLSVAQISQITEESTSWSSSSSSAQTAAGETVKITESSCQNCNFSGNEITIEEGKGAYVDINAKLSGWNGTAGKLVLYRLDKGASEEAVIISVDVFSAQVTNSSTEASLRYTAPEGYEGTIYVQYEKANSTLTYKSNVFTIKQEGEEETTEEEEEEEEVSGGTVKVHEYYYSPDVIFVEYGGTLEEELDQVYTSRNQFPSQPYYYRNSFKWYKRTPFNSNYGSNSSDGFEEIVGATDANYLPTNINVDTEFRRVTKCSYRYSEDGTTYYEYEQEIRIVTVKVIVPEGYTNIYKYWNQNDHFYTNNFAELGASQTNFEFEGIPFYIAGSQITSDAVPFYRYYNAQYGNHFYTADYNELGAGSSGYVLEGTMGYINTSPGFARVPLYRYYSSTIVDHFYTTNINELGPSGSNTWNYEGIAGYVITPASYEAAEQAVAQTTYFLQTVADLQETNENYAFELGDYNGDGKLDLYYIKKTGTGTNSTEIHVLNGADNFHSHLLHTGTLLAETTDDREYKWGDYNGDGKLDLYIIKKSRTGTNSTEVHILSGADNFKTFLLRTGTDLQETNSNYAFELGDYNNNGKLDIYYIKKTGTGTNSTEIHVLNGADNFQTHILHTGTLLAETTDDREYKWGDYNGDGKLDLYIIKKSSTDTNSTEVHILNGSDNFKSFLLQTGTALHETDSNFEFELGDYNGDNNLDLYAIRKSGSGTNSTEVHVLNISKY